MRKIKFDNFIAEQAIETSEAKIDWGNKKRRMTNLGKFFLKRWMDS